MISGCGCRCCCVCRRRGHSCRHVCIFVCRCSNVAGAGAVFVDVLLRMGVAIAAASSSSLLGLCELRCFVVADVVACRFERARVVLRFTCGCSTELGCGALFVLLQLLLAGSLPRPVMPQLTIRNQSNIHAPAQTEHCDDNVHDDDDDAAAKTTMMMLMRMMMLTTTMLMMMMMMISH